MNSATYSPRHPVSSVHQAVALVGRNQLESLLITYAVGAALPRTTTAIDMDNFWLVAARRAAAAGAIATAIDPVHYSETFTAALLQDMAQPLLVDNHAPYAALVEGWQGCHRELAEVELEAMGWTHAQVGTWMCRSWGFPEALISAIEGHHGAIEAPHQIVQWASRVGDGDLDEAALADLAATTLGIEHETA